MKKITGFVILICTFTACQDSSTPSTLRTKSLRDVGGIITKEEAQRWRSRYENGAGLRQQSAAIITKASLQHIVSAIPEYDGVYFHHALESERHHILVIPYKDAQALWSTTVVVDAISDSNIDVSTADLWAEEYVAQNPDGPWSHFFGRHVFEAILSKDAFDEIEIIPAINDAGLPQLLLYVSYSDVSINGRTKGQVEVYDQSNQCPPFCSEQ